MDVRRAFFEGVENAYWLPVRRRLEEERSNGRKQTIAQQIGCPHTSIDTWIRDHTDFQRKRLSRLAAVLGVALPTGEIATFMGYCHAFKYLLVRQYGSNLTLSVEQACCLYFTQSQGVWRSYEEADRVLRSIYKKLDSTLNEYLVYESEIGPGWPDRLHDVFAKRTVETHVQVKEIWQKYGEYWIELLEILEGYDQWIP